MIRVPVAAMAAGRGKGRQRRRRRPGQEEPEVLKKKEKRKGQKVGLQGSGCSGCMRHAWHGVDGCARRGCAFRKLRQRLQVTRCLSLSSSRGAEVVLLSSTTSSAKTWTGTSERQPTSMSDPESCPRPRHQHPPHHRPDSDRRPILTRTRHRCWTCVQKLSPSTSRSL
jgi:hypothetical protein